MKGVQCYELFGGIALKIHTFSVFSFFHLNIIYIIDIFVMCSIFKFFTLL